MYWNCKENNLLLTLLLMLPSCLEIEKRTERALFRESEHAMGNCTATKENELSVKKKLSLLWSSFALRDKPSLSYEKISVVNKANLP